MVDNKNEILDESFLLQFILFQIIATFIIRYTGTKVLFLYIPYVVSSVLSPSFLLLVILLLASELSKLSAYAKENNSAH